jgi:hypothetical protein
MIRGKYHTEQKEKGKAAHDKEFRQNRRKRIKQRRIRGKDQTEQKEK